jgi:hypothetical protein
MPRCAQASPAWGDERHARRAIAPLSRDTPGHRLAWQRSAATLGRSSMPPARAGERPPASRCPARGGARSLPAPQTRDSGRRVASLIVQTSLVACRPPSGTILFRQPATHRPQPQHPHSPSLPQSPPRTVAAHRILLPAGDQVRIRAPALTDPNAASEWPSQLPPSRCCDDHLSPPCTPRSLWCTRPPWRTGRRSHSACSSASSTKSARAERDTRQPTMRRAKASMTKAT